MTDNRTTELHGILDEFEHECFMLRVEASETRARDDVVRKSYESIRDEFAGRIAALVSDREAELQSALNKAAGNWAKADALLRERTSGSEAANPQIRCTDSKRNAPVRDGEDSHTLLPCPFCGGEAKAFQHGDVGHVVQCRRCGIWNAGYHAAWSHITEDEFNGFIDEESAIEAWNTRTCGQCEYGAVPMTEENMAAHGWFTREDVEGAFVSGYSLGSLPIGSDPRWDENEQTVDEHMAELGWVRERTCRLVGTLYYDGYDVWYHELSCGHEVETLDKEPPSYCPDCGAEVMDA